MVHKEEDIALLLSHDDLSGEDRHGEEFVKPNSFTAALLAVSCLCAAGTFIAAHEIWCYEPVLLNKEKELLRFYVLIGGILSAILSGRAVDFFGRRSSVIFAAICWLLSLVLILCLSILHTRSLNTIKEFSTHLLNSHEYPELPHALISDSRKYIYISQRILANHNSLFIKPDSVHLNRLSLNGSKLQETLHSMGSNEPFPCRRIKVNSGGIDIDGQGLPLLPQIITSLLIGVASTSSIVSGTVYVFEISRKVVRGRYIALSDFLYVTFVIILPMISLKIVILTLAASLPVIFLEFLNFLPIKFPNYFSFPSSPFYLILKYIIRGRNGDKYKDSGSESTGKNCVYNFLSYFSYSSVNIPFTFHAKKSAFYLSRKNKYEFQSGEKYVSDNEEVGICGDKACKKSEFELGSNQNQTNEAESQELSTDHSRICMGEDDCPSQSCNVSSKSSTAMEADGSSITECCNSDHDGGMLNFQDSFIDCGTRKTLSYLYGICEVEDIGNIIQKEFLMDVGSSPCKIDSFFNRDMKKFNQNTCTVFKLCFPLLIIQMSATDCDDVANIIVAVMLQLSICGSTAAAAVSILKVISSALSMLLLDKIGQKKALMIASTIFALSSLFLGIFSPYIIPDKKDHVNVEEVKSLTGVPTMYPLLPTPLPQLLQRREFNYLDEKWNVSLFSEKSNFSYYSESDSLVIWLTLISAIFVIGSKFMFLVPLTRLSILSAFPTYNRGIGIGFTITMQYLIHLIRLFLPCSFVSKSFALIFRSGACIISVFFLLFVMKPKNYKKMYSQQRDFFNRKLYLLFKGKIFNMYEANSSAV